MSMMSGIPFYVIQGSAPNLLAGGSGQVPNQLNSEHHHSGWDWDCPRSGALPRTLVYEYGAGSNHTGSDLHIELCLGCTRPARASEATVRNNLRGPGFFETDLSIFRTFIDLGAGRVSTPRRSVERDEPRELRQPDQRRQQR